MQLADITKLWKKYIAEIPAPIAFDLFTNERDKLAEDVVLSWQYD